MPCQSGFQRRGNARPTIHPDSHLVKPDEFTKSFCIGGTQKLAEKILKSKLVARLFLRET
jgi:hypothetical protein